MKAKQAAKTTSKAKSTRNAATAKPPPRPLEIDGSPGEPLENRMARAALRPTVNAAIATQRFANIRGHDIGLMGLVDELAVQCAVVKKGDLGRAEAMLVAQAHTLDAIFTNLAGRAANNLGHYPQTVDTYLRLALRAQSQCRATLETLATIKNPPLVFAKQANIAHGPQQVNNGTALPTDPARGEKIIEPSKLLESSNDERLDFGSTTEAGTGHQDMAAVATIDGTEKCGG